MRYITLFVLLAVNSYILDAADENSSSLPPSANSIVMKLDEAISKLRAKAAADLQKSQDIETKKGNLEGAISIKKKIEELTKLAEDGKDLLGNRLIRHSPWANGREQ